MNINQTIRNIFFKACHPKIKYISGGQIFKKNAECKIQKNGQITLGKVFFNSNVFLSCSLNAEIKIGNNVTINRNSIIACKKYIEIGSGCSIGPNVCIYDHDHEFDTEGFSKQDFKCSDVIIGENVWIAAGVIILRGTNIGSGSVIAAGAVVSGIIPPHSIVKNKRETVITEIVSK